MHETLNLLECSLDDHGELHLDSVQAQVLIRAVRGFFLAIKQQQESLERVNAVLRQDTRLYREIPEVEGPKSG
jgi:hypothetical protein